MSNKISNQRLKEIDEIVDKLVPIDYFSKMLDKYSDELEYYKYIDTVEKFSLLPLKGSMKYINKYDKKLRNGGLVVKIYQKEKKWYAIIKKDGDKKYYISFDSNYIFYCDNIGEIYDKKVNKELDMFIKDCDSGKYEII